MLIFSFCYIYWHILWLLWTIYHLVTLHRGWTHSRTTRFRKSQFLISDCGRDSCDDCDLLPVGAAWFGCFFVSSPADAMSVFLPPLLAQVKMELSFDLFALLRRVATSAFPCLGLRCPEGSFAFWGQDAIGAASKNAIAGSSCVRPPFDNPLLSLEESEKMWASKTNQQPG